MFEKFRKGTKESSENNDPEAVRKAEIEKIYGTVFVVESSQDMSFENLISSAGVTNVDSRITEEKFPRLERLGSSNMQVVASARDSFIEDTLGYLEKEGQHPATIHDLLEFMPQCPELVWRLCALGSLVDEDNKKFCVVVVKKEGNVSLSLQELGQETFRDGVTHYYTPWPASLLTVQNVQ
ncbi:MAG: hypothetical protein PHV99_01565 [Candidatus Pacebacteria bacterium]|nr:hypothetical protein [Candidatus Paceibacterota bacterium]